MLSKFRSKASLLVVAAVAGVAALSTVAQAVPPVFPDVEAPVDYVTMLSEFNTTAVIIFGVMAAAGLGWVLIRKALSKVKRLG